ncbi:uncharacterized protein LOC132194728 [Neocloeon triangulifer]|uniref:uncharacterized protein LOC132194728 n=1 Tax=Neocloeon triangulifer TaxID=2078957 RepID=UPI00286F39ED|nr:uncharacterized protein LOC132194728 [Neocloeon triangulifer]XP_059472174.1 uncharacterized protein LOC132194728 [Neocloeon triangulifer]
MAASILRRKILFQSAARFYQRRNYGYYVLLPETKSELPEKHVLTRADETFPSFDNVVGDQCVESFGKIVLEYETGFWKLEEGLKSVGEEIKYEDVVDKLDELSLPLDAAWGVLKTFALVNSNFVSAENYSQVHDRARNAKSKRLHSKPIYEAFKKIQETGKFNEEETRTVKKFVLEGRLNGLDLAPKEFQYYSNIIRQIGQERGSFFSKTRAATEAFRQIIGDSSMTRDFPRSLLAATAQDPSKPGQGPWTITLKNAVANPFMQYCPMRELRWNVWQASVRRCSNEGDRELNNSVHIEQLRSLRKDQSKLLGFDSFAAMSMETKMAGKLDTVRAMIATLLLKAKPAQEAELVNLLHFAQERGFEGDLMPWDISYWKRKQQRSIFKMTEEEMQLYFPLDHVLSCMFRLAEKLFQLEIVKDSHASTWDTTTEFYQVRNADGRLCGGFYFDPYLRPETKAKSSIGWMLNVRSRNLAVADGGLPLAALVFNFQPPNIESDTPTCLTYPEIKELFSKFGHMLQHVLASANCSEVAGLTNLEWDAVNISSELMALWLTDPNFLQSLSHHHVTGEQLSEDTILSLSKSNRILAGHELCRELYLSTLDMDLHSSEDFWLDIVKRIYPQYMPFQLDKRDAHPCSFTPIFSGDWAAAYYSGVWGRMVAADAYTAFKDSSEDVEEVGKRFRQSILEPGGAVQPAVAFRRFRGRDPSPNALLNSLGLKVAKPVVKPTQNVVDK